MGPVSLGGGDFQQLTRRYRDRIFTFAFYTLRHREDAEDVTQEVLIRMWRHRRRLDLTRLPAWVIRVTRNACYDVARRQRVRKTIGDGAETVLEGIECPQPGPEAQAEGSDFQKHLLAALARLPEPYRSVVVLREVQELKYEEIAAALDKPLNTVKVYLHRGRKMLRAELTPGWSHEEEETVPVAARAS